MMRSMNYIVLALVILALPLYAQNTAGTAQITQTDKISLSTEAQALNDLVNQTEVQTTEILTRLNSIITEFDRREACHSITNGGGTYTGENCYISPVVEDFYLQFMCSQHNFSGCKAGYVMQGAGTTVDHDWPRLGYCGRYCKIKIGNVCIWYGPQTRRYAFCVKKTGGRLVDVPAFNGATVPINTAAGTGNVIVVEQLQTLEQALAEANRCIGELDAEQAAITAGTTVPSVSSECRELQGLLSIKPQLESLATRSARCFSETATSGCSQRELTDIENAIVSLLNSVGFSITVE